MLKRIGRNGGFYGDGMPKVSGDDEMGDRASLLISIAGCGFWIGIDLRLRQGPRERRGIYFYNVLFRAKPTFDQLYIHLHIPRA